MYRIWMLFDPRRTVAALSAFLFVVALVIHFALLNTVRYNWLDAESQAAAGVGQMSPLPAGGR